MAEQYVAAYRHYAWPAHTLDDFRLAPFHLLASEEHVHIDQDHAWHMHQLARLCIDPIIIATRHRVVDLTDPASQAAAIGWWEALTAARGEGMVVKPLSFLPHTTRDLVQPAAKCPARAALHLIYVPAHTA